MISVTPIGVLSDIPAESKRFYSEVLEIERVHRIQEIDENGISGTIIKLESPNIEVFSTETRYIDRRSQKVIRKDYILRIRPKNIKKLLEALQKEKIPVSTDSRGNLRFQDINGIQWEIRLDSISQGR